MDTSSISLVVLLASSSGLLLLVGVRGYHLRAERRRLVRASSTALAQVTALNRQFPRLGVSWPTMNVKADRHVDSKAKFDRVSLQQALLDVVAEREAYLRHEVEARLAARRDYDQYKPRYESARLSLGISSIAELDNTTYRQTELDLFNGMRLQSPKLVACLRVSIRYSSPAGRNSYVKGWQADFEGLVALLEELNRLKHEQSTTMHLRRLERNKVTPRLRFEVLNRDGHRCRSCGASAADGITLHVDHIHPVAKGGRSDQDNLQTLCQDCNLGKGDRILPNHQERVNVARQPSRNPISGSNRVAASPPPRPVRRTFSVAPVQHD